MSTALDSRRLTRWFVGVLISFGLSGLALGSWLSRLPSVRDRLDASTVEMSFYGVVFASGSVLGTFIGGRLVARLGPHRALLVGLISRAVILPSAALLIWQGFLIPGLTLLFGYGFAFSITVIAQNVSGAAVEQALNRSRLPVLHAAFSLGSMSAMLLGAAAESLGVPVPLHLACIYVVVLVVGLVSLRWIPEGGAAPRKADPAASSKGRSRGQGSPWRDPRILLLALIVTSMAIAEGGAADWLPLALVDGRGIANETGALILGVFYVSMTLTRLVGGPFVERFGRVAVLRTEAILLAVGVTLVIVMPATWVIVIGAVFWGIGCALGFPLGISAAADNPETAARDVAAVSAVAYCLMLLGPMLFGFLGQHIGLLTSFWLIVALAILAAFAARAARRPAVEQSHSVAAGQ